MAEAPAGERTEEATPRRIAEARRRGEIARSRELSSAVVLGAIVMAYAVAGPGWLVALMRYLRAAIAGATHPGTLAAGGRRAFAAAVDALALPLAVAALAAIAVGLAQSRGLFTFEAVRLDLSRVLPRRKRVLSGEAAAELAKGVVKVVIVSAVAWIVVAPFVPAIAALAGSSPWGTLRAFGVVALRLFAALALAALALGVGDYLWQQRQHRRALRMTRDEVRREHKDTEGDPRHKAERARLNRELDQQRMLADVRKADFVIVNPDHIAVAIRYDRNVDAAPVVVAKGERLAADQIKTLAREAGIPIFRDVTLARSLRDVAEGDEIPEALYEAVAEILRALVPATGGAGPDAPTRVTAADARTDGAASFWRRV